LVGHAQALIDAKAFDWAGICRDVDSILHSYGPHAGYGSYRMFDTGAMTTTDTAQIWTSSPVRYMIATPNISPPKTTG
jgi:hypothetical protein